MAKHISGKSFMPLVVNLLEMWLFLHKWTRWMYVLLERSNVVIWIHVQTVIPYSEIHTTGTRSHKSRCIWRWYSPEEEKRSEVLYFTKTSPHESSQTKQHSQVNVSNKVAQVKNFQKLAPVVFLLSVLSSLVSYTQGRCLQSCRRGNRVGRKRNLSVTSKDLLQQWCNPSAYGRPTLLIESSDGGTLYDKIDDKNHHTPKERCGIRASDATSVSDRPAHGAPSAHYRRAPWDPTSFAEETRSERRSRCVHYPAKSPSETRRNPLCQYCLVASIDQAPPVPSAPSCRYVVDILSPLQPQLSIYLQSSRGLVSAREKEICLTEASSGDWGPVARRR